MAQATRSSITNRSRSLLIRPVKKAKRKTTITLDDVVRGTSAARRALRELGRIGLEQTDVGWIGYINLGDDLAGKTRPYATPTRALHALIRSGRPGD
jgi:hypothetical protein